MFKIIINVFVSSWSNYFQQLKKHDGTSIIPFIISFIKFREKNP